MNLGETKLGDEIIYYTHIYGYAANYETTKTNQCTVISKDFPSQSCVGFTDYVFGRAPIEDRNRLYKYIDGVEKFPYHRWLYSTILVVPSPQIYLPNQKCLECKRIAPHHKPNQPNDMYLCSSCVFIKGLLC